MQWRFPAWVKELPSNTALDLKVGSLLLWLTYLHAFYMELHLESIYNIFLQELERQWSWAALHISRLSAVGFTDALKAKFSCMHADSYPACEMWILPLKAHGAHCI